MDDTTFWMVWSPEGRSPTHKHELQSLAAKEAERLARMNPGNTFYVLEAVEARQVNDMKRVVMQRPIPF